MAWFILTAVGIVAPDGPPIAGAQPAMPNLDEFVIFSTPGRPIEVATAGSRLWTERPRHSLNEDGLVGFLVANSADRLATGRMWFNLRYHYSTLTSRFGRAYYPTDRGFVHTWQAAVNYMGEWAEWSAVIPVHQYVLEAPRTYGTIAQSDTGLGDMKLGVKFTYLPDKSYYRWAYGAVVTTSTGHPDRMRPAGPRGDGELKLFGAVTTRETDNATFNLELGGVLAARGDRNRMIYNLGLAYEAGTHTSLFGEFAGEVQGGDDQDSLDWITGMRLSPTPLTVLELAYTKNLRTFREFGYDDRWTVGFTMRW